MECGRRLLLRKTPLPLPIPSVTTTSILMPPPSFIPYGASGTTTILNTHHRRTQQQRGPLLSPRALPCAACGYRIRAEITTGGGVSDNVFKVEGGDYRGRGRLGESRDVVTSSDSGNGSGGKNEKEGDVGGGRKNGRSKDYWANVGQVIETLRNDYCVLGDKKPDFGIYAENIMFTDKNTFEIHGLKDYMRFFWVMRLHLRVLFRRRDFMVQSLYHDAKEGVVYLRWRGVFVPRIIGWIKDKGGREKFVWIYDAISVYKVNRDGMVCEHVLDNNLHLRSKLRSRFEEILSIGRVGVPGRTPAGAGIGGTQWWKGGRLFERFEGLEREYPRSVLEFGRGDWKWIGESDAKDGDCVEEERETKFSKV